MNDWRVQRITQEVKKYDRRLYAVRASNGMIQIHRKADRIEASDFNMTMPELSSLNPQFILALTDTWKLSGKPVEWGLEPIMRMIRNMDSWNQPDMLDELHRRQEADKERKQRRFRNDIRAMAADMRKDFARATNDLSTS